MCTTIELKTHNGNRFFGRNMDVDFNFDGKITLVKRGFTSNRGSKPASFTSKYAVLGTAIIIENYPLFADGFNERGLVCAALNFPHFCVYQSQDEKGENNIPVYDTLFWILANFSSVSEVKEALKLKKIVDIPFSKTLGNTTLHWCVHDHCENIVIECTKYGLEIHQNPVGVLTNAPPFEYQLANLSQFIHLKPTQSSTNEHIPYIGQGCGLIGIPGDFSSPSRFIRASILKSNSDIYSQGISQTFHLLDNLAMIKGTVITQENKLDMTVYSSCFDLSEKIYYYKTYDVPKVYGVSMPKENIDGGDILTQDFIKKDLISIQSFNLK